MAQSQGPTELLHVWSASHVELVHNEVGTTFLAKRGSIHAWQWQQSLHLGMYRCRNVRGTWFHEVSWSFMKFHASWNVSKQKWFASAAGLRTITVIIVMQNLWHANSTWVKEDKMWQDMTRYDKIWQDRGMKGMKVLAKVYLGWNQILSNTSTQGILVSDLIWQNKKQAIDSRLPPPHNAYNI